MLFVCEKEGHWGFSQQQNTCDMFWEPKLNLALLWSDNSTVNFSCFHWHTIVFWTDSNPVQRVSGFYHFHMELYIDPKPTFSLSTLRSFRPLLGRSAPILQPPLNEGKLDKTHGQDIGFPVFVFLLASIIIIIIIIMHVAQGEVCWLNGLHCIKSNKTYGRFYWCWGRCVVIFKKMYIK